jgi:hypothetical protein
MTARPERNVAWVFAAALRPIAINDESTGDTNPGTIVRGQVEGVEGVLRDTDEPRQLYPIILRPLIAPKSYLGYCTDPHRCSSIDFIGRVELRLEVRVG